MANIARLTGKLSQELYGYFSTLDYERLFPADPPQERFKRARSDWVTRIESIKQIILSIGSVEDAEMDWQYYAQMGEQLRRAGELLMNFQTLPLDKKISRRDEHFSELDKIHSTVSSELAGLVRDMRVNITGRIAERDQKEAELHRLRDKLAKKAASFSRILFKKQATRSGWLATLTIVIAISVAGLIGYLALTFYSFPIQDTNLNVLYQRIGLKVLSFAFLTFLLIYLLRLTKAYLGLVEQYSQRSELLEGFDAFINAISDEQRDTVVVKVIDALASNVSTGLVQDKDDASPSLFSAIAEIVKLQSRKP